jgi:CelD/BcsL family acetyltransferase involved in cellulose biosynthesis
MSQIESCAPIAPLFARSTDRGVGLGSLAATELSVELADAAELSGLGSHWSDLVARADSCNVFMHPLLVSTAAKTYGGENIRVLLAWTRAAGERQLAGIWAFSIGRGRKSALPIKMLNFPAFANAYVASPVIDRRLLDAVWTAMLDRLADDPAVPKIASLEAMPMDRSSMTALARLLAVRRSRMWVSASASRPSLASRLNGKQYLEKAFSSSTRKKLRQHRNRLGRSGALAYVTAREPERVGEALEDFLTLELAGWKGKNGTALLCSAEDADFARTGILALARAECASIHGLYLDRRPLSMQVILQSGREAFTWKTAYDEQFRDFSPGMLLFEHYTDALLSDPAVSHVDSCAYDEHGFMAAWTERQTVADLWFDVRPGGSLMTEVLGRAQVSYRTMRDIAKARCASLGVARRR